MLKSFVDVRLKIYADKRNDPNANALSNLSPWYPLQNTISEQIIL
jgi:deoxyribodipyrimidine photo-lyase